MGVPFDVAIRLGALDDSTLIARTGGAIQYRLCASELYLAPHGRPRARRPCHSSGIDGSG